MYDIYLLILFKIFTLLKISFDYVVWLIIQVLPDSDPFSNSPHDSGYSSSDSSFSDSSSSPDTYNQRLSMTIGLHPIVRSSFISSQTTDLRYCFPNVLEPSTIYMHPAIVENPILHSFITFLERTGDPVAFDLLLEYCISNTLRALILDGTLNADNLDSYYVFMKPNMVQQFTASYGHLIRSLPRFP